ncbi:MAG: hypothetical protein MUC50_13600 [Myxococcota bacterium]|nr:hypothetical protein [Myxococcota bacterium]
MAPDGQSPPLPADLSADGFINPRAPSILSALQYLRSAGKSGKLNPQRTLNATSIIADLSLRPSFKSIWSDPVKLAVLLARYVSALLPNKEHTFSMVDAVTALEKGFGDCTEHSVLLASFLRAENIPSRLVSGMLLTHGGLWIYHMWNEYWDGSSWQAIDASRPPFKTDAMYVSIGRGVSRFTDSRSNLSRFIESAFSGVSFDLVAAWADGMDLPLSHPKRVDVRSDEAIVLESMVLSRRGDWASALRCLDSGIAKEASTLSQKLLRLEYLTSSGRCDEALSDAAALLKTTSAHENVLSIRLSEINCHIRLGHIQKSRVVLKELRKILPNDDIKVSLLDSQITALETGPSSSRAKLEVLLQSNKGCLPCLAAHANTILESEDPSSADLTLALSETLKVLDLGYWADVEPLLSFSKLLTRLSHRKDALFVLDHALLLRPLDPQLLSLRDQSIRAFCGSP